jgi:hypothetical protein
LPLASQWIDFPWGLCHPWLNLLRLRVRESLSSSWCHEGASWKFHVSERNGIDLAKMLIASTVFELQREHSGKIETPPPRSIYLISGKAMPESGK